VEDRRAGGWPLSMRPRGVLAASASHASAAVYARRGIGDGRRGAVAIGAKGCGAIDGRACDLVTAGGRDALL
jgi:hypothetical protein